MTGQIPLKKFGKTMTIAFAVFSAIFFWKGAFVAWIFLGISAAFLLLTVTNSKWLGPIQEKWMKFAHFLGIWNTRIILSAVYFLVFTPFRILAWIMRKDFLDRAIEKNRASYWTPRIQKEFVPANYERQF